MYFFQITKTTKALNLAATNAAEGFEPRGHVLIGDTSTNFNSPSYTCNGFPSIGTESHEDLFDPAEHYTRGQPSFSTLPQQQPMGNTGFDVSSHQHHETPNVDTQSYEDLFDPAEHYTRGQPSFSTLP